MSREAGSFHRATFHPIPAIVLRRCGGNGYVLSTATMISLARGFSVGARHPIGRDSSTAIAGGAGGLLIRHPSLPIDFPIPLA